MLKVRNYIFLIITFFIYSLSLLFSKIASMQADTINFFMYYIISIFVMGVYAIFWQLILKKIPLSIAFPTKAVTIVFSLFLGYFIFSEAITLKKIISIIIIMIGVVLVGYKDNE